MAGPHQGQPVLAMGSPLSEATAAMILLHGRGASAPDVLTIAAQIEEPGVSFLAPEAAGNSWWPNRFMEPLASNEPWLSSALELLGTILVTVEKSVPVGRIALLGFSQGGCLALEFAARNSRPYGALIGLSAGLVGPDDTPRDYAGSLAGTPVFLGCSDVDPHIPAQRVEESGQVLAKIGGEVTLKLYPGMGHEVNADEMGHVRRLVAALARREEIGEAVRRPPH